MASPKRRLKAESGTHRSSKAKVRLLNHRSKASTEGSQYVVTNGLHTEAGFRDVRTNYEKNRLLQWVRLYDTTTDRLG
jgi:hypothetical protein